MSMESASLEIKLLSTMSDSALRNLLDGIVGRDR
jgi:hypothetical protein